MIEVELKSALLGLQTAISNGDAAGIKSNLAAIEEATVAGRKELDPQLKHYLKNRSYMKALAYLSGESDIPKGRCGGRTDFS